MTSHDRAEADPGNLFLRNDTIFGVCEGIGQDFGFNPNWLRVVLAAVVIWSPAAAAVTYLGLGLLVLASRLVFPRRVAPQPAREPARPVEAANSAGEPDMPLAA